MLVNYSCSTSQTLHTTEVITHTQGDCADTHWGRMSDNLSWWKEVQFGGGYFSYAKCVRNFLGHVLFFWSFKVTHSHWRYYCIAWNFRVVLIVYFVCMFCLRNKNCKFCANFDLPTHGEDRIWAASVLPNPWVAYPELKVSHSIKQKLKRFINCAVGHKWAAWVWSDSSSIKN